MRRGGRLPLSSACNELPLELVISTPRGLVPFCGCAVTNEKTQRVSVCHRDGERYGSLFGLPLELVSISRMNASDSASNSCQPVHTRQFGADHADGTHAICFAGKLAEAYGRKF